MPTAAAPLPPLDLASLREAYRSGSTTPSAVITALYPKLVASGCAFIHLERLESLLQRCAQLEAMPEDKRGSLWGVPGAVKDNVDVGGMPTTAACSGFKYTPEVSAPAVAALEDAGSIIVGKTNMDQFAAGLVGTRSPYGTPTNPFHPAFLPGGSSSGSGVAVGGGLVTYALGTDTAGSGRVPAGFNGCVGMKGTVGSISTVGVVPACASLDCLTVFTRNVLDGAQVMRVMCSADAGPADVFRRTPVPLPTPKAVGFRFAVPPKHLLDWGSPDAPACVPALSQEQFELAAQRLAAVGGVPVEVDFGPFARVAAMLYGTSFVAERYSGIRKFLESGVWEFGGAPQERQSSVAGDERLLPVTRHILSGTGSFSAPDVYDHLALLAVEKAQARAELAKVDVLLVPTALAHYTVQEVSQEESASPKPGWSRNAKLGRFTNFVNLLDMCGVAVPSGTTKYDAGGDIGQVTLPFGVTLLAPAWQDEWLWGVAAAMHRASGLGCGPEGHGL